ncbi:dihydropyrimidinase [Oceanobacillus chungangensis]|uniref:Dihydropyrimidinase n=1 Tax=Oceanobacillus chungangensis TaxID=1229152 RepID=A0A3D8PKS1_9BACI|nr:dihydropyrimidinase [Oceanobacillus chungangensis]RDW16706.1 dihydropyrimidinase [Oceanobacillus chungangensis]
MRLLIKNGNILSTEGEYKSDIYVEGEKIVAIGKDLNYDADQIVDATGKYVFPGGVDEHVHYGSFGTLDFNTSNAPVVGGTTTIVDFPNQIEGRSIRDSVNAANEKAKDVAMVDYAFHGMVMYPTEDLFDEILTLPDAGISTIKFFMAYKGTPYMVNDDWIFRALQVAKEAGVTVFLHAENGELVSLLQKQLISEGKTDPIYHAASRPPIVEAEATRRAIYMAELADSPLFFVHVSTKESMEAIRDAYESGLSIYGETCTHYLTLTEESLAKPNFEGAKFVCSPALRKEEHVDALWQAVQKGWLKAVGSDHAANVGGFEVDKKKGIHDFTKIPNGCPSAQDRLALLWTYGVETKKITKEKFVELFATNPAKVVGLPGKGQIAIGYDADIVIFDPEYRGKITVEESYHQSDYNTFEGMEMIGRPEKVYLRGQLTAENGKFVGRKGQGKYIKAKPYGLCYDEFKEKEAVDEYAANNLSLQGSVKS